MTSDVSINICRFEGRKCDINGNYIKKGEPFLSIFNIDIKNRNIEKKISKLKENTIECKRIDSPGNANGKCAICEEHGERKKLQVKSNSNKFMGSTRFLLCNNCINKISENAVEKSQEINKSVHYWNPSGICVFDRELFEEDYYLYDNISCEKITDDVVIMIAIYDNPFYCSIHNIENLKETLKQKDPCNDSFSCDICQEEKSDIQMIYSNFMMCDKCREDILIILEEYIENNKEFIISRTI